MRMSFSIDHWELKEPFVTAQDEVFSIETLTVYLDDGPYTGRGEALGVDYFGETAQSLSHQVMAFSCELDAGLDRAALQELMPPGGARNAVDCALWDLACKREGKRAWDLAGVTVAPARGAYTLSLGTAEAMAAQALAHPEMPVLKLKLDADDPAGKLAAVRAARPDAELIIDANGGWNPDLLATLGPALHAHAVGMVEQPLPRGEDAALDDIDCPVALCADESCQHLGELEAAAKRYDLINIKLDKCGGLTEALAMMQWCRANDCGWMVGNMLGSSLAMAPAMLLTTGARWVDLDGPLWQRADRAHPLRFEGSRMHPPEAGLWG